MVICCSLVNPYEPIVHICIADIVNYLFWLYYMYILNPSAWEYQSAVLDCIYHTARQSSTASADILGDN